MLCLCFRQPTQGELNGLLADSSADLLFVLFDKSLEAWAVKNKYSFEAVELPSERSSMLNLHDKILAFSHSAKNSDGINVVERLAYAKGFYPWFLIRKELNASALRAYREYIAISKHLAEVPLHEKVSVVSDSEIHERLLDRPLNILHAASIKQKSGKAASAFKYLCIIFLRAFLGLFHRLKTGRHLFLNSNMVRLPMFNIDGNKIIVGDPIFGYLHSEVTKHEKFQSVLLFKNFGRKNIPPLSVSLFPDKMTRDYSYFETFLVKALLKSRIRSSLKQYRQLLNRFNHVSYEDPFYDFLFTKVQGLSGQFVILALRYEAALKLLAKVKPLSVGGDDEFTHIKYPVLMAARSLNIPTYGIQHGVISIQNVSYTFCEGDVDYLPFPTKTFIWGEGAVDRLTKLSTYRRKDLTIVGQIRTDVIPALKQHKPEHVLPNYTSGERVLLFASQPLSSDEMRARLVKDILRLKKDLSDVRVVIKPHPNEVPDLDFFYRIGEEVGVQVELSTHDLYGLLSLSDVVVTYYSTVGMEALYFDKELVVLDYDAIDGAGYIRNQVAHHCKSFSELKQVVTGFYNGSLPTKEANRRAYIKREFHEVDGRSRYRTIEAITELSNEKTAN